MEEGEEKGHPRNKAEGLGAGQPQLNNDGLISNLKRSERDAQNTASTRGAPRRTVGQRPV